MTDQIKTAAEVALEDQRTEDERRRQASRRVIAQRAAKREAVRRAGGDVASSSPDLSTRLEARMEALKRKQHAGGAAKLAVAKKLAEKQEGK